MLNKILIYLKALTFMIINFPKIICVLKLFNKLKYNDIIELNQIWLKNNKYNKLEFNKDAMNFFTRKNIAIAYVYLNKSDEGFEYIKDIVKNIKQEKLIEEFYQYFIYPEFKNGNYDKIIYRSPYFYNIKRSKEMNIKIGNFIYEANKLKMVNKNE